MGWDRVSIKDKIRKTIKPRVGIEYQSFKNIVAKLVEKGIFLRSGRGELEANPFIFARGDWPSIYERRKSIELTITYDTQGRHFKSKLLNK